MDKVFYYYKGTMPESEIREDGKYLIKYKGEDRLIENREFEFSSEKELTEEEALELIKGTNVETFGFSFKS